LNGLEALRQYCFTDRQRQVLDAIQECGSQRKAATSLGIGPSAIQGHIYTIKRAAAKQGWSPDHDMTNSVPEGFHVKGVSTLYDQDGNIGLTRNPFVFITAPVDC